MRPPVLLDLANLIVRGGWPGNLDISPDKAGLLAQDYIHALLAYDIHQVSGTHLNAHKVHLLLRSLARNESTAASNNTLIRDMQESDNEQIDANPLAEYVSFLERLFLLDNLPAFAPSMRSTVRIRQASKRHFVDPSLACALLGITDEHLMHDLETFGFLFESPCPAASPMLSQSASCHPEPWKIPHGYQTHWQQQTRQYEPKWLQYTTLHGFSCCVAAGCLHLYDALRCRILFQRFPRKQ